MAYTTIKDLKYLNSVDIGVSPNLSVIVDIDGREYNFSYKEALSVAQALVYHANCLRVRESLTN